MPYKDKEQQKAFWRRRNARPARKAYMGEYAKERMTSPDARRLARAACKRWSTKPESKVALAAYAMERRKQGKVPEETKVKQLDRKKLLRQIDGDRIKARDQARRDRMRARRAGRPKPDACEACGDGGRIHFDHCHRHGHFRGWLCQSCNLALGFAKDDATRLRKLIAYLERNRTNTAPQLVLSGI